ncbi:MAG: methanogenesis marker 16 metalloprotein [Halobacteriota archaeon]|nr:methanogenesis marker 16 metalloprotein [Halobacteriota archaeon]
MKKSISEIKEKIKQKEAVVMTAKEISQIIRERGEAPEEVDVVTTATRGIMSGTAAIFSIPVAERGEFKRADKVWLNGVFSLPGPCPNERLGLVDVITYGTMHSKDDPCYGGGHLFRDFVEGRKIDVMVEADDGKIFEKRISKDDISFARMFTTRGAFKNYMGFVNREDDAVKTIFHVTPLKNGEFTFSGCGEISPLENDPHLRSVGIGTKILLNGAVGYVVGEGTGATPDRPNLSISSDMFDMDPECMGGFLTSDGPEVITSVAVPIPITDDDILKDVCIMDEDTVLPVADIHDRVPFQNSTYADVWQGTDLKVDFSEDECIECEDCVVESLCPTCAFTSYNHNPESCFNCGACVNSCSAGAFKAALGGVEIDGRLIPVGLRLSDRFGAEKLETRLKKMIESGDFEITDPVDKIRLLQ